MKDGRLYIAYILLGYPTLRTTFIRREIETLRKQGIRIEVFAFHACRDDVLRGDAEAIKQIESTHYLPENPFSIEYIWANIKETIKSPRNTVKNLAFALNGNGFTERIKQALHVWRAALVADKIRKLKTCQHIHTHFAHGTATTALSAARLLNLRFSFTSHTSLNPLALGNKLKESAFVSSISEYDREYLLKSVDAQKREIISRKIHIVHCSLPLERFPFSSKEQKEGVVSSPVILSVGALEEKKGHDILIRSCRILLDKGISCKCRIVGGFAGVDLKPLIAELNMQDHVTMLGGLSQDEVRKELLNCDIFALACRQTESGNTDGIPVALMEPMAIGRPVISTRIAGIPELVIDGQTGFLADPGDHISFANKLEFVINHQQNMEKVIKSARKHIEINFDSNVEARKLSKYFAMHMGNQ